MVLLGTGTAQAAMLRAAVISTSSRSSAIGTWTA
jgi:hypothetical protein